MQKTEFSARSQIFFLIKFFREEIWADELMSGTLYLNRVSWFKQCEKSGDRFEAVTNHVLPGEGVSIKVDGLDLSQAFVSATFQDNWLNGYHLFCVYAVHSGNIDWRQVSHGDLELLLDQVAIPQVTIDKFGPYAVVIRNWSQFWDRVDSAATDAGYEYRRAFVKYYDPKIYSGIFEGTDALFHKRSDFASESEYRFAFGIDKEDDGPRRIEIGDINDIAIKSPANQISGDFASALRVFVRDKKQAANAV